MIKEILSHIHSPTNLLRELNCKSICLGNYIEWNTEKNSKIISKKLGWKGDEVENVPKNYSYEKNRMLHARSKRLFEVY